MEKMFGGDVVARMLHHEGVEKVFGIIDGTYFGFYSSLRHYGIELITPRHEACAVHMAAAYARVSGKLGVCMASNGPGVANVLPGVAVENGEGNRVLLITSTRRTGIGYPDRGGTYQYFNQSGVLKPMTKWSGAVPSFERIPELLKRAFRTAWQGRPGVVHLDVPENILNNKFPMGAFPTVGTYRRTSAITPDPAQVQEAARLLHGAQRPLIHAGSGVLHAGASDALLAVAELLHAPVCNSWAGRGAMLETSPLALPMLHVALNNLARNEADVVLTLGSRIGETDWWGKAPYWAQPAAQQHIQVDIDEDILGLNKPVNVAVLADIGAFLPALAEALRTLGPVPNLEARKATVARYTETRQQDRAKLDAILTDAKGHLTAAHVATTCQAAFKEDAIVVLDGGNTAVWGNFYHQVRTPRALLWTPKFGMLGAGVAQALGAQVAFPERQVYCIIGDGAMGFNQQEIETAVRNRLKVIYLVCCDKQWGMVKLNQQYALKPLKTIAFKMLHKTFEPNETINTDFCEIQFDKLAQAMGAHGERVSTVADLRPAIDRAIASQRCAVIHVDVDPVKHMWAPSLLEFKKMHQEPAGK